MNYKINGWQIVGFTTLYSVALAIFPKTASAAQAPSLQKENGYQVAQVTNCREVDVNTALNVRRQPYGQVIGTLQDEQNVSIVGEPENGWVRISGPMNGYVFARYLNYCTGAASPAQPTAERTPTPSEGERISTVPGSNCRAVVSPNLQIRTKPGGEVVGTLKENQTVYIANEGVNGWVPIERPMSGFVSASNLGPCPEAASPSQPTAATTTTSEGERISTVPGSNCREVISPNVQVRTKPGGEVVGTLEKNQMVYIANEGVNGWVPIEKPMSGFVSSANLGYCPNAEQQQ